LTSEAGEDEPDLGLQPDADVGGRAVTGHNLRVWAVRDTLARSYAVLKLEETAGPLVWPIGQLFASAPAQSASSGGKGARMAARQSRAGLRMAG
jgi:hypothetical protein